jgi:hypothetical protein
LTPKFRSGIIEYMNHEEEKLCSKMMIELYLQGKVDLDDDDLYTFVRITKIPEATVDEMVEEFKKVRKEHEAKG